MSHKKKIPNRNGVDDLDWNVPDRLTAKTSYSELKTVFPCRTWNLV